MKLQLIQNAQQRYFDFYRLFMDAYMLQIEASTWLDEADNRLNIIFPDSAVHYQVTDETYKTGFISKISAEQKKYADGAYFLEVMPESRAEYSEYMDKESGGIFDSGENFHIYILLFIDHVIEVVSRTEPMFVYSYTNEWIKMSKT